jgi:hypothetical protein
MDVGKVCPPKFIGTGCTISLVPRRPSGDCIKKFSFISPNGIACFRTNVRLMNVCDAPESKKHNYRVICNRKHTHHNGLSLWNSSSLHIKETPSFLLDLTLLNILTTDPMLVLLLLLRHRSFLEIWIILPRIRTLPREMSWLSAIVARIVISIAALSDWRTNARGTRLLWIR